MSKKVEFRDLGLIDYKQCWDFQEKLFKGNVDAKMHTRKHPEDPQKTYNYLIFCEHPHVYTLGKSGSEAHLLVNEAFRKEHNIDYYKINRGGDITYHGPGQIVGYPILDLENFFTDIHKYLRLLEESIILTLKDYGLEAGRIDGLTGVWLDFNDPVKARKICAMGVKCSRWVSMHGFAFNINADLNMFKNIVPCGIDDKNVTSLNVELGREIDMNEVKDKLKNHLAVLFEMDVKSVKSFSTNEV